MLYSDDDLENAFQTQKVSKNIKLSQNERIYYLDQNCNNI